MNYGMGIMKFIFLLVGSIVAVVNAEVKYVPRFTESVESCKDFDNQAFNCDGLVLGHNQGDDGEDIASLGGEMKTLEELGDTIDIALDIWKITDMDEEFMYSTRSNLCSCLKNTDAPWYPIVDKLDLSCPIPVKTFSIDNMEISLNSVNDFLSHEFCGEYRIELSFIDKQDKISCQVFEIAIDEVNEDDE